MIYNPPLGGGANDPYINANPGAGIDGSIVPAPAVEHTQREIIAVITGAGITPNAGILNQLFLAIQSFQLIPPGVIMDFGGVAAPAGYLLCNGAAVSRTTYAALFAVTGTTFGVGDGATTFNVPDSRGRGHIGAGAGAGLTNRVLGTNGGAETHVLTIGEMPAHTHTQMSGNGDNSGAGTNGDSGTTPTGSAGGGAGHNNMQPWLAVTAIIKT